MKNTTIHLASAADALRMWEFSNAFMAILQECRIALGRTEFSQKIGDFDYFTPAIGSELNSKNQLVAPVKDWNKAHAFLKSKGPQLSGDPEFRWIPRIPTAKRDSVTNYEHLDSLDSFQVMPYSFINWFLNGRLVIVPNQNLDLASIGASQELPNGSLQNFLDQAFVIRLNVPLSGVREDGRIENHQDFFVVCGKDGKTRIFSSTVSNPELVERLSLELEALLKKTKTAVNKKQWPKVKQGIEESIAIIGDKLGAFCAHTVLSHDGSFADPKSSRDFVARKIRNMVCGLSILLYRHINEGMDLDFAEFLSIERADKKKVSQDSDPISKDNVLEDSYEITDPFTVSTGSAIFLEKVPTRRAGSKSGIQIRIGRSITSHWRRPYWRRPKGEGSNPLAQATIEVKGDGPNNFIRVKGRGLKTGKELVKE